MTPETSLHIARSDYAMMITEVGDNHCRPRADGSGVPDPDRPPRLGQPATDRSAISDRDGCRGHFLGSPVTIPVPPSGGKSLVPSVARGGAFGTPGDGMSVPGGSSSSRDGPMRIGVPYGMPGPVGR